MFRRLLIYAPSLFSHVMSEDLNQDTSAALFVVSFLALCFWPVVHSISKLGSVTSTCHLTADAFSVLVEACHSDLRLLGSHLRQRCAILLYMWYQWYSPP